ncbi:MAG: ABC transporter ATP-binding protein [Candidatus Eremiobacteraeota bacterium]|nr:ABC transporter ATP-binding protein [Candidatus Eremiobacteraeota bacterium]MCL5055502.1 ABC transporter ATP-binding protein [Bacillota bacterium]
MKDIIYCDKVWKKYRSIQNRLSLKETILGKTADFHSGIKAPEEFWVLKDISFFVQPGESLGVLGKNGAGKSTLLRVIASILVPTRGSVKVEGRVCPVLSLGVGFQNEFTGEENVYLAGTIMGTPMGKIRKAMAEIVEFSGIGNFIEVPVKHYSTGMLARLGFATAVYMDSDIFLIDETLSVGDISFQKKCLEKLSSLKKEGKTLILVTHAPELLLGICEQSIFIHHHTLFSSGKTADIIDFYKKTMQKEDAAV